MEPLVQRPDRVGGDISVDCSAAHVGDAAGRRERIHDPVVRRQKSGGIKILYVWVAGADARVCYGNEKILSISIEMG